MALVSYAKRVFSDFISTLYPDNCINCLDTLVTNEQFLCTSCMLDLPQTNYHLDADNPLYQKFAHNPSVIDAYAFLYFQQKGVAQKILHELKYKSRSNVGTYFGSMLGAELLRAELTYDIIVPVPIHWRKKKKRGYNQSDFIAKGIANVLDVPVDEEVLTKVTHTQTQTSKTKLERWKNVEDSFRIVKPTALYKKKVLLVDDVITTGATLSALCDQMVKCDVESITLGALATGVK